LKEKHIFGWHLVQATEEMSRIWIRYVSVSVIQWYGSVDRSPYQHVIDPEPCFQQKKVHKCPGCLISDPKLIYLDTQNNTSLALGHLHTVWNNFLEYYSVR
jgi:hypothetical protein